MKVLVTGGTGFLGSEICRLLNEAGLTPVSFQRSLKNGFAFEQRLGDLRSIGDISKALEGIDAVVHTAAKAGIWGRAQALNTMKNIF